MCYPYDGIRSMASEYNACLEYIKKLKEENRKLKELNEKYLNLLIKAEVKEIIEEQEEVKRR